MAPRNHSHVIGRLALALGLLISAGVLLGAALRLVSIGYLLFWLLLGLQAISAFFLFGMVITVQRDRRTGPYRGGNLNEYVVLSLIFDRG